jgi:2-polyprenyl-3-methyl-5-hydroxy-6-metoxy-1,4-benzoquinol methylase
VQRRRASIVVRSDSRHVAGGRSTPRAVADAADADERATASLMLAVSGLGLLEPRADGGYALAPDAAAYLVRGRDGYLGDLRTVHRRLNFQVWPRLTESLQTGAPPEDAFDLGDSDVWDSVLPFLESIGAPAARWIAGLVQQHAVPCPRVLDVGCGSGLYGRAIAQADRTARVVGLDRPAVIDSARERARALDVDIDYKHGDVRTMDWGTNFDVVVLSHVLHGYDPDTCAELLTRAAAALAPCGLLVIHEFVPNPAAPVETPLAALFGLEMLLTSSGAAYPAARYRDWIEAAGLIHAHHELAPAGPTSAILARSAPQ